MFMCKNFMPEVVYNQTTHGNFWVEKKYARGKNVTVMHGNFHALKFHNHAWKYEIPVHENEIFMPLFSMHKRFCTFRT